MSSKRQTWSPEARAKFSAETKARMASDPTMSARISERTKAGLQAASGELFELRLLRDVWARSRPQTRERFLKELFAPVCSEIKGDG